MQGKVFIDLYYETYEESVEKRGYSVTVYVLDDETAARYKEQNDAILRGGYGGRKIKALRPQKQGR